MSGDVTHGNRHSPRGTDPMNCDVFREVGNDEGATIFINGFNMAPTTAIPNPAPLQYRLSVGPPNLCDYDPAWATSDPMTGARPVATSILEYTDHQIEIQGDVDGVSPGDIVFILPLEYRKNKDLPYHSHDHNGIYVPCRLLSTGEFIYGVP